MRLASYETSNLSVHFRVLTGSDRHADYRCKARCLRLPHADITLWSFDRQPSDPEVTHRINAETSTLHALASRQPPGYPF